jgi:hypothetical protein
MSKFLLIILIILGIILAPVILCAGVFMLVMGVMSWLSIAESSRPEKRRRTDQRAETRAAERRSWASRSN